MHQVGQMYDGLTGGMAYDRDVFQLFPHRRMMDQVRQVCDGYMEEPPSTSSEGIWSIRRFPTIIGHQDPFCCIGTTVHDGITWTNASLDYDGYFSC